MTAVSRTGKTAFAPLRGRLHRCATRHVAAVLHEAFAAAVLYRVRPVPSASGTRFVDCAPFSAGQQNPEAREEAALAAARGVAPPERPVWHRHAFDCPCERLRSSVQCGAQNAGAPEGQRPGLEAATRVHEGA